MSTEKTDVLKMQVAKALMEEGHKETARAVLEVTNHPKASEWLVKLPKEKRSGSTSERSTLFMGSMIGLIVLVGLLSFMIGRASAPSPTLAELVAATLPPATVEFEATVYEATRDTVRATNDAVSTVLALTSASPVTTPPGN